MRAMFSGDMQRSILTGKTRLGGADPWLSSLGHSPHQAVFYRWMVIYLVALTIGSLMIIFFSE